MYSPVQERHLFGVEVFRAIEVQWRRLDYKRNLSCWQTHINMVSIWLYLIQAASGVIRRALNTTVHPKSLNFLIIYSHS